MRINDESTRFSPQIAALAMPGESGYKAAAEGISNVGKVFQDQQDREQTSALNALKMSVAQEELKGKQFENSIAGEEWDNKKTTYAQDLRNKKLEGLKKEIEWKADVKKQTENGFMDQFKKVVPSQTFIDPKNGKFSEELYQGARNQFKSEGGWAGENIHLFDALADGYRKESLESGKTKSEIASKEATTAETKERTRFIAPKANADIAQSIASANSSNTTAEKNKVETQLLPAKMALDTRRETRLEKSDTDQAKILARQRETKSEDWGRSIAGFDSLDADSQSAFRDYYNNYGVKPTVMVKKGGVFSDDVYSIKYPSHVTTTVTKPTPKTNTTSGSSLFQQSLQAGSK